MDYTRFILFTSLAIISYLMLLAWEEDYPTGSGQVIVSNQPLGEIPVPAEPGIDSIPTPANTPTNVSDVPTQLPATNGANAPVATINSNSNSNLISVETDTFRLSIDPNGGDITYLALPEYLKNIDVPDDPFVLLANNPGRSFVAQSGLIGVNGIDVVSRANYVSNSDHYELAGDQDILQVDLQTVTAEGVEITKRFTLERGSYLIGVSYIVNNVSNSSWQANAFGQIKRDNFDDPSNSGGFMRTFLGFVTTADDDPYVKLDFDDVDDGTEIIDKQGGWIGFSQHYFLTAWLAPSETSNRFSTRKNNSGQYIGGFTSSAFVVDQNSTGNYAMQFYAGPKDQYALEEIAPNLDLTIDYGILSLLAKPIYWLLYQIYSIVGNFGLAIILLTIVVKGIFYKLSETQYKSMAGMRRIMPKMQQLKESYGDDRMKLQKATMELYKKEKINPFNGCLPMLVQMPVFISLYWVLLESVELRHAPFILWLNDLSVRDPYFVLPLLMGATMFLQTRLSPTPADPMQAKVMMFMPIMMTAFFLWFPAGLVLYWLTNSALGILQQWYITRKIERSYQTKKAS